MIVHKKHLVICCFLMFWAVSAAAQNINTVAQGVAARHDQAVSEKRKQDRDITKERQALRNKVAAIQGKLAKEQQRLAADKAQVKALADERDRLQHEIATRLASKEELDTIFLDNVRNFLGLVERSPYSSREQYLDTLSEYLSGKRIFDLKDMTSLMGMYFDDIAAGSQVSRFTGKVLDRGGEERKANIITLGHMGALFTTDDGNTGFLTLSPGSKRLLMSGDPGFFTARDITSFFAGEKNVAPMDISGGVAISQLSRKETLEDRLKSGGVLVIPILLVGLAALIIALERLIFLSRVRSNTDALMTKVTELVFQGDYEEALAITKPQQNRPTGKVLMAGLVHRGEKYEVIESAMSETMLTQIPRLERFIGSLKVLAAVAPLLGLLGTVTGMINTFQVITIHGTGDPRLMAGGISEAMVTTQVGLAVAIPIMMMASFLGTRVKNIARDMEEKGIALMGALLKHDCPKK